MWPVNLFRLSVRGHTIMIRCCNGCVRCGHPCHVPLLAAVLNPLSCTFLAFVVCSIFAECFSKILPCLFILPCVHILPCVSLLEHGNSKLCRVCGCLAQGKRCTTLQQHQFLAVDLTVSEIKIDLSVALP
jgi:hypothetical protein